MEKRQGKRSSRSHGDRWWTTTYSRTPEQRPSGGHLSHLLERPRNPYDSNRLGQPAPARPVTVDVIDSMVREDDCASNDDQDAEADPDETLELSHSDFAVLEDLPGSPPSSPEGNSEMHAVVHDNGAAAAPRTASLSPGTRNGLLGQTLAVELHASLQALRDEHKETREVHKQNALALHEEHALKMEQLKENHADELAKCELVHDMQVHILKTKLKIQRLKARLRSKQLNDKAS